MSFAIFCKKGMSDCWLLHQLITQGLSMHTNIFMLYIALYLLSICNKSLKFIFWFKNTVFLLFNVCFLKHEFCGETNRFDALIAVLFNSKLRTMYQALSSCVFVIIKFYVHHKSLYITSFEVSASISSKSLNLHQNAMTAFNNLIVFFILDIIST